MNLKALVLATTALLFSITSMVKADDLPAWPKQCSFEITTTAAGITTTTKMYMDNGKIRTETTFGGMQTVSIIIPDQKKMYTVMVAQKMVMERAFDPSTASTPGATPAGVTTTKVGPDTVDGVACTKYLITTADGKKTNWWFDASNHPYKMTTDDNSATIVYKNFTEGAQDASLFVPPADYKTMEMPATH